MNEQSTEMVVALANDLISFMQDNVPGWGRGFLRFFASKSNYGSGGSYIKDEKVYIMDTFQHESFFTKINEKFLRLLELLGKREAVLLLCADCDFNFEMKYEFDDMSRWRITKLNGGNGLPDGL